MKKLLFLLFIALTVPVIANTDKIKMLEDKLAVYEKKEAKQKEDDELFIKHRNAIVKNTGLIAAGAVFGGIISSRNYSKQIYERLYLVTFANNLF